MDNRIKEIREQFLKGNMVNADVGYLLDALEQAQTKLQQHEAIKGVLTWWTYKCGHTVQNKYTNDCPVCVLQQLQVKLNQKDIAMDQIKQGHENQIEQSHDRERVLREALGKIVDYYNKPYNDLRNITGDMMCQIAREALGQEEK